MLVKAASTDVAVTSPDPVAPSDAAPTPPDPATRTLRRCTRCVMDTSDPEIEFDSDGVCSHCRHFENVASRSWFPGPEGESRLAAMLDRIRRAGAGREYDCIIGLSGGVDSCFLAYKVKEWQLRPLVVHVDAGWNSELAVKNIENVVKKLNYDLFTHVVDWEEMRDLQCAFLRAGLANQDVPQDHVFFATLRRLAIEHGIHSILTGSNIATESILPRAWGYNAMDAKHLLSVHRRFGRRRLESFHVVSFLEYYFYLPYVKRIKIYKPLNLIPYVKRDAKQLLERELNWKDYGGKHFESRFTKFFQAYYLPEKFGFDKRKAHLSSLVVSGQMTRDEALAELQQPLYRPQELEEDREFVLKKLGMDWSEFDQILHSPNKTFRDYPCNSGKIQFLMKLRSLLAA